MTSSIENIVVAFICIGMPTLAIIVYLILDYMVPLAAIRRLSQMSESQKQNHVCPLCHGKAYVLIGNVNEECPACDGAGAVDEEEYQRFQEYKRWKEVQQCKNT